MFSESEIAVLLQHPFISQTTGGLKNEFIRNEAEFLEISDHDFLSLIMLTPSIGIAMSNGNISLLEEISLNKRARKLSKGGYFMKSDPVVSAMNFLIKNYSKWEDHFFDLIAKIMNHAFSKNDNVYNLCYNQKMEDITFAESIMNAPYILVRFLSSLFLKDDEEILNRRKILMDEYNKIQEIGKKLGLEDIPLYNKFLETLEIKK